MLHIFTMFMFLSISQWHFVYKPSVLGKFKREDYTLHFQISQFLATQSVSHRSPAVTSPENLLKMQELRTHL